MAHYDLKPGNVLLSDSNTPVLMDFGSVRPARQQISSRREALQLQEFASINCTMPYRAPELWEPPSHCTIDERVDSWSLGCVLYALCYGRSPFDVSVGEVGGSVAVAVASGRVEFPTPGSSKHGRTGATTSDGFQDLVRGMLALEPDRRLSVAASQDRCRALLSGQPQP
jgi:serine/threonine kinase 16